MLCKQETEYLFLFCLSFTYGCYMKDEIDRKLRKLFRTGFWLNKTGNENVNRSYAPVLEQLSSAVSEEVETSSLGSGCETWGIWEKGSEHLHSDHVGFRQ